MSPHDGIARDSADPPPQRGAPGPPVPWAGWAALADTGAIYVGAQFLVAVLVSVRIAVARDAEPPLAFIVVASPLGLGVVTYVWLRVRYGTLAPLIGRRNGTAADVGAGVGAGIAAFVLVHAIVLPALLLLFSWLRIEEPVVQETFRAIADDPATLPLLAVTAVALAPITEELLFRGVLFRGLRERLGFPAAAVVSAAAFTLVHLEGSDPAAIALLIGGIMPLGLIFAWLVERRGGVMSSVIAHATYNGGNIALLLVYPSLG